MIRAAAALAATLGLGLAFASCSSGPREGQNEVVSIPTKLAVNLIHSGDPTLGGYGRTMTNSGESDFLKVLRGTQAECRKIGVG